MTTAAAAEPRIHELLLENLFAVFGERDPERRLEAIARTTRRINLGVPEQPPAVSGIDVALVRDGRIAVLHTLLTAKG
jgi:hypothetical protein